MNVLESLMLALLGLMSLLMLATVAFRGTSATAIYVIITLIRIPQLVLIPYIVYHPLRGRILVKYITVRITNLRTNAGQSTE